MNILATTILLLSTVVSTTDPPSDEEALRLLRQYTANQQQLESWILTFQASQTFEHVADEGKDETIHGQHSCVIRSDGERTFWRWHKWGGEKDPNEGVPKDGANYLSMLWDGQVYSSYRTGGNNPKGVLVLDANPPATEVKALQCEHTAAPLMGYYLNTYQRIDEVLHQAGEIRLRARRERVNDVNCHVIEATTPHGDYTVWIDPLHGWNVAKVQILMQEAAKHIYQDGLIRGDAVFTLDVHRFEQIDEVWVAAEATWGHSRFQHGRLLSRTTTHVTITDLTLNPDHESLRSFVRDDVKEEAWGWIVPFDHIKYTWRNGEFVPQYDERIVAWIDKTITAMAKDATDSLALSEGTNAVLYEASSLNEPNTHDKSKTTRPGPIRPYCGLYCLYSTLRMVGEPIDLPDLIKPEYLGSRDGSSILELRQAARDFGLSVEPAARLSASGLRNCPYRAILHVRSQPESPKYDHYELFLGVEKGKARLFNPPEASRLVSFADLATQWDGKALFISDKPIDTDLILAADRQRLLRYAMIGVLAIVLMHFGKRIWLSVIPPISRRWAMGLTVAEVAMLGLAALLCGGAFHFFRDGGLLANASATQALQKGHAMNFVPKVHEKKVQRLLGSDAIFIDARLASDYERGHLAGAISLPIDANDAMWEQTLAKIPQGQPIVTYCQSAGCKFAEKVSLRLIEEGCTDIALFKGGWAEWVAKHGRPQPTPEPGKEVEAEDADQNDPT